MTRPVLHTRLCDILGIECPIVLAGMGLWGQGTPSDLVVGTVAALNGLPERVRTAA